MSDSLGHFIQAFEQQTAARDALQPLLELIIDQSGVGIIVADARGVLRAFNAEAEIQHGKGLHLVPADAWIQTYGLMNLDGSALQLQDLALYRALRGERVDHFCYLLRTSNGEERVIEGNANPLRHSDGQSAGAVVITRDETAHYRATKQLQDSRSELHRSEALKSQMITNSADCLLNIRTGGGVACLNTQASVLLGLKEASAPPAWRAFWPGKRSRKAAIAALRKAWRGEVARFEGRTEFVLRQSHWWSVVLCPIRDAAGQVDSVFAALRDVTGIKQAASESRRRATFAQQLMGIVSHDLRNPIGAILLSASQMQRRTDLDDKAKRSLGRMIWSAERANRLIYDLLDFTQAQLQGGLRINRQWVNAQDILQRVLEEIRAANPARRIDFCFEGEPSAEIDPDRVSQIITNLVANALQHSPEDLPVAVRAIGNRQCLCIKVHNDGPPIDPALLPRLFSPMQRGTRRLSRVRSIGLGLYIVKLVAQAHGGEATVQSNDDIGTEFIAMLPRRSLDAALLLPTM